MENSQLQTANVFNSLWNESHIYDSVSRDGEILNWFNWTNGNIDRWLTNAIRTNEIKLLDAGCGTGWGASILFSKINSLQLPLQRITYTGIDLIEVSKTRSYLENFIKEGKIEMEVLFDVRKICMMELNQVNEFDIVYTMGTLHHTPDLQKSLESTYAYLKPGGTYISRIINKQKPLRGHTDDFFRQYFRQFSELSECEGELKTLAQIFEEIGKCLDKNSIEIERRSELLDLNPGIYKLQELLYDYFIKCYYKQWDSEFGEIPFERSIHQLFDWFSPHYYHQTNSSELQEYIQNLEHVDSYEIIEKTNGLFFSIIKSL